MLKTGIANAIQEMCSCNFSHSDLEGSEVTCLTNSTTLTFTTTVVYSTESGDTTASTLIRMFQDRAVSTSPVIPIAHQTATIVSVCNPSCTPEIQQTPTSTPDLRAEELCPTNTPEQQVKEPACPTPTSEPQEMKEPLTSNAAALVGAYLGGVATGIVILIIATVIVW